MVLFVPVADADGDVAARAAEGHGNDGAVDDSDATEPVGRRAAGRWRGSRRSCRSVSWT